MFSLKPKQTQFGLESSQLFCFKTFAIFVLFCFLVILFVVVVGGVGVFV